MDTTEENATSEIANENVIVKRNHKSRFLAYIYIEKGSMSLYKMEKAVLILRAVGSKTRSLKLSSFQLKSKLHKSISGKKHLLQVEIS